MRNLGLTALVFCLVLGVVKADIITVQVKAEITQFEYNGGYFDGSVFVGSLLTMTYSYDTETPNSNPYSPPHPNGENGIYYQTAPNIVQVNIGNYVFESDIDNLDYCVSLSRSSTDDTYQISSYNNISPTYDYSGNYGISWQISYVPNTFEDMSLPTSAPDIESFTINRIWIFADRDFNIYASPTSVEIIPEPITLLTLGLGGLIIRLKRR